MLDTSKSLVFSEDDNTIGRDKRSTTGLTDESMSRRHAIIGQDGKPVIFDMGSRDGMVLNGQTAGV